MIFENIYIMVPAMSFCIAQLIKFIIEGIRDRRFTLSRLLGFGGMPSGHSALTLSLTTLTLLLNGAKSVEFGICFILTCIVLADAIGVRLETSRQAIAINELVEEMNETENKVNIRKLKEKVGHKPIEVIAGGILGVIISIIAVQLNIF